jgi:uncharacterized protein (TIGR02246 family)
MASEEVQRLRDESAIRALTAYYSDAVTHLDAARAASIYAEDGCVSIAGAEICGRAAIEEGMRQSFAAFDLLRMIAHGGVVEVKGDTAKARWSTIELTIKREAKDLGIIFGRYEDELVRLPAGWRFRRRSFTMGGRLLLDLAKVQLNPEFFASLTAGLGLPL